MKPNSVDIGRKKSHCLRNCVIVFVVMTVLLFGALCGGAYFAYEQFGRPILNISLGEVFGVIRGLGSYKEKEIVTNPFKKSEVNDFYTNLEEATYLVLPDDFSISKAVNESLKQATNGEGGGTSPDPKPPAGAGEPTTPEVKPGGPFSSLASFTTGNTYLDEVLKQTHFDFSQLLDQQKVGRDLVVKDTQFAAIMDEVISNLEVKEIQDIEKTLGIKFKDLVSVKQVVISGVPTVEKAIEGEGPVAPGIDGGVLGDPRANIKISLVLCVDLGKNIPKILASQVPNLPDIVGSIATGILPAKIFIGAGVHPYDESKEPTFFVNNIKDKVMTNLRSAVDGILKYSKSDTTTSKLFGQVAGSVTQAVKEIEKLVGELRFEDSSMKMDPISVVMGALGVNKPLADGSTDHYVNSQQFFTMVKHLFASTNEIKTQDVDSYLNSKVGAETRIDPVNSKGRYEAAIEGLASAYGITSTPDFNLAKFTPNEFMTNVEKIPEHIDIVNSKVYNMTQAEMKDRTIIGDNALGYMFNEIMKEEMAKGTSNIPIDLEIVSFDLYKPAVANSDKSVRAKLAVGVATEKLLEGAETSILYGILHSVIPTHLYMELDIGMVDDLNAPTLIVNFIGDNETNGIAMTKEAFDVIYNIVYPIDQQVADKIKLENLLNTIKTMIDDMMAQLQGLDPKVPSTAGPEGASEILKQIHITKDGITLPTIYDIIQTMAKLPANSQDKVQVALKGMYTVDDVKTTESTAVDEFIARELYGKMHMVNDPTSPITKQNLMTSLSGLKDKVILNGVGAVIDIPGLMLDPETDNAKMRLAISPKELAGIVTGVIDLNTLVQDMPFTNLVIIEEIDPTISADIKAKYMPSFTNVGGVNKLNIAIMGTLDMTKLGASSNGLKMENLLPSKVILRVVIDMDGLDKYGAKIYINGVDNEETKATIESVIKGIMGESSKLSFQEIENTIKTKMAESLSKLDTADTKLSVVGDKLVAISVYDVLYDSLLSSKLTAEEKKSIKAQQVMNVVKGLYDSDISSKIVNPKLPKVGKGYEIDNSGLIPQYIIVNDQFITYDIFTGGNIYEDPSLPEDQRVKLGEISQFAILAGDGVTEANTLLGSDKVVTQGLLMTASLNKNAYKNAPGAKGFVEFLPNAINVTMLINIASGQPVADGDIEILINNLTAADKSILFKMLGTDNDLEKQILTMVRENILNVQVTIPGLSGVPTMTLNQILTSDKAEYIPVYTAGSTKTGVFGKIKYNF